VKQWNYVQDRVFKQIKKEKCILLVFIKQKKKLISCSNCCSWWVFWVKLIWNDHDVHHRFFTSTSITCNCAITWLFSHQHLLQPLLSLHTTPHKHSNTGPEIMPQPLPSRSWDSSVTIVPRPWAGQSTNHGLKPSNGRPTSPVFNGYWGTLYPEVKQAQDKLTTHLLVVLSLRMPTAVTPLPHLPPLRSQEQAHDSLFHHFQFIFH